MNGISHVCVSKIFENDVDDHRDGYEEGEHDADYGTQIDCDLHELISIETVQCPCRIHQHDGVLQSLEVLLFKNVLRLRILRLE